MSRVHQSVFIKRDEWDEARFIADTIGKDKAEHAFTYGDIAILYRTNAQSRVIEETFMRMGLPYTMVGGLKFYDRKEIKDILAYLRFIYNPLDSISMMRIINVPKRGLGATSLVHLTNFAAEILKCLTPYRASRHAQRRPCRSSPHFSL